MSKLVAEFLYEYQTVINGQTITVKRYDAPRLVISAAEKRQLEQLFKIKDIENEDGEV